MESKRWLGSAAAVLAALLAVAPAQAAMIPDYGVSELSLGGASYPVKMADNATVLGVSREAAGGKNFAFVYRGGSARKILLDMRPIDPAGNVGTMSYPTDINSSGDVIGKADWYAYISRSSSSTYRMLPPGSFFQNFSGTYTYGGYYSYSGRLELSESYNAAETRFSAINNLGFVSYQVGGKYNGTSCSMINVSAIRTGGSQYRIQVTGPGGEVSGVSCGPMNNNSNMASSYNNYEGMRGVFTTYLGGVSTSYKDIGNLGGGGVQYSTRPYFINDSDRIGGQSQDASYNMYAFSYDPAPNTMTKLSLGGTYSDIAGVSRNGLVIGSSYLAGDTSMHAFVYNGSQVSDLGTLGGKNSFAVAVNNAGYVVGNSQVTGSNEMHAFLYNGSYVTDLGTLGGPASLAKAINSNGQVVGISSTGASAPARAFLYSDGLMVDVNALIPPASGYTVVGAESIDDDGKILAVAVKNGKTLAVLLEPSGPPIQR